MFPIFAAAATKIEFVPVQWHRKEVSRHFPPGQTDGPSLFIRFVVQKEEESHPHPALLHQDLKLRNSTHMHKLNCSCDAQTELQLVDDVM